MAQERTQVERPVEEVLWTVEDMAVWFGCRPKTIHTRLRREGWPHRRVGKTYLFTSSDRHKILEMTGVNQDHEQAS